MRGMEFLHNAIYNAINLTNELADCDYLADTDKITIPAKKVYAIIITEEPFDFQQVAPNAKPSKRSEDYIVNILMKTKSENELTLDIYSAARDSIQAEAEKAVAVIAEASKTANGISGVVFGKASPDIMDIEGRAFMWLPVPVKIVSVN